MATVNLQQRLTLARDRIANIFTRKRKPRVTAHDAYLQGYQQAVGEMNARLQTGGMGVSNERGTEGLNAFAGQVIEAYLPQLRWPAAYKIYDEMRRRDPTLRSINLVTKTLARNARPKVISASDAPADRQAAEFLEDVISSMSVSVSDFIDDTLTALPFGWSSFEKVYRWMDNGRIGWRKLAYRRQSSLAEWKFDKHGGTMGWWQEAAPDYQRVFLPITDLLNITLERDGQNPEGMALYESIYEPWHYVKNLQIIGGIGWQRTFVGLPVFKYEQRPAPGDTETIRSIGQGLRVGAKSYVSIPPGIDFSLESTTNSGGDSLLNTIMANRRLMLQTVLADGMMLGMSGSTGSWSLGSDKSVLFLMMVDGFLDRIYELWNRFGVDPLFALPSNQFPGMTGIPQLAHTKVQKVSLTALGAFIQQLAPYIPIYQEDATWIREQAGMARPAEGSEPLPVASRTGSEPSSPGLWQYPAERKPVGSMAEAQQNSANLAQRTGDPDQKIKNVAEDATTEELLQYFTDLRKRVLAEVKAEGLTPPTVEEAADGLTA